MNKKTILGVVCAIACATNLTFVQPAIAKFMSAAEQERQTRQIEQDVFGGRPETYSDDAKKATPIVQRLQKRICDLNGIEITTDIFQNSDDFKTKVHPVRVVDYYNNACSVGAGYTYIGVDYLRNEHVLGFFDQYSYIFCEHTIAHEIGHAIGGHTMLSRSEQKNTEELAEKYSFETMCTLPEGGWGAYLVSIYNDTNRPKVNIEITKSFITKAEGKISIPDYSTTVYHAKKGGKYNLCPESGRTAENTYFGGQVAECIALGALTVNTLAVIPVPKDLQENVKFSGNYLLVCQSSKLPNGYRVLASLWGSQDKVMDEWRRMKQLVIEGNGDIKWYSNMRRLTFESGKYNMWKMWLALAVANDVQTDKR